MKPPIALGVALMVCAGALLLGCSSNQCSGGSVCGAGNAVDAPSKTAQTPTASAGGPLLVTHKWPTAKYCDGSTSVAMPAGGRPLGAFDRSQQDFRSEVATPNNQGGTWGSGLLYLDLSAEGTESVTVDELHLTTRVPKKIGPPQWVALTQGGCGDLKDRVFDLDLDTPKLVDRGVIGDGEADPSEPPARTNPLGSGFTVSSKDPAIIRVDVYACHGNYEWSLQVDYSYHGQPLRKVVGPFRSFGAADHNTAVYTPDPNTGKFGAPSPPADVPIGCRGRQ